MSRIIRHDARGPALIETSGGLIAVCQCGLSRKKPFCDGSHAKTANEEPNVLYAYNGEGHRVALDDLFPPPSKKYSAPK